jgi:hypothetical protein
MHGGLPKSERMPYFLLRLRQFIFKLSDSDDLERRGLWIPAFAGMTNKTQRVPVMSVPDLVRDDGSPMNAGSLTGIQSRTMPV